jgi:hypothetical protein
MTRQKKNLKTVSVHYKNTDLILKMIKKAKISRVRVPLSLTFFWGGGGGIQVWSKHTQYIYKNLIAWR